MNVLCYEAGDKRASPDIMARYREYMESEEKKLPLAKRHAARAPLAPRTEAEERAALRSEYFRLAYKRHRKTASRGQERLDAF